MISLLNFKPVKVPELDFSIVMHGPIANPRIKVDHKQLTDTIKKAGIATAKKELESQAIDKIQEKLGHELPEDTGKLLKGFFERSKSK